MEILIAIFGAFTLASAVALFKFEGNPLFVFSLLLSLASMVWLIHLARQEGAPARRTKRHAEATARRGRRTPGRKR